MFDKMSGTTPDLTENNIEKLKHLFPEIIVDGKIDFEKLQLVLGKEIDDTPDRYNFTWHGKKKTMQFAQQPSKATLRPVKEKSKNWDTTGNIYIEGDNLEVLKLLQKSYNNKVKMIYIDPPYNTGNDFVYKDDFKDSVDSYLELTGQKDNTGNKFNSNTESNGRYHTEWLNMMYSRLKLAKNLLCETGAIFISIDDNETHNLRKICDEIFGEKNFVAQCVRKRRDSQANLSKNISPIHEYVVIYSKNNGEILNKIPATINEENYKNPDNDERGPYVTMPCTNKGGSLYSITTPTGNTITDEWRFKKETYNRLELENKLVFPRGGEGKPRYKLFLNEKKEQGVLANTWLDNISSNQEATREIKFLFNELLFDTPKPTGLLKFCLQLASEKDSIIVDFFSGSATTAHATMELNAEDGGTRKFIMVQLPEILDEKSGAYKNGYRTICDIGEERIRRGGDKLKNELIEKKNKEGMLLDSQINPDKIDIGFKVFSLDSSNLNEWQADFDNIESNIDLFENNFVDGRSEEDVLYEIIIKNGLDLTYPINEVITEEFKIYDVAFGNLFICLNDKITRNVAHKIVSLRQGYGIETSQVVFKDNGFENDTEKLNCYEILKDAGYQDSDLLSI